MTEERPWSKGELIGLMALWLVATVIILVTGYYMVVYGFPTMSLGPKVFCLFIFVSTLQVSIERLQRYSRIFCKKFKSKNTP